MLEIARTYLFVIVATIVLSMIIMIFVTSNNIVLERKQKTRFCIVFALIGLVSLLDMATTLMEKSLNPIPAFVPLQYIFNTLGFGLSPLIPLILCNIAYKHQYSKYIIPMWAVYFVIITILIATNNVFIYNIKDGYQRIMPGFIFYLVFYYLSVMFLLVNLILLAKKMISKTPYLLFFLFFILIAGTLVQVINSNIHVTYLIVCIVTIIFYDYISSLWSQIDGLTGVFSQYTFMTRCKYIKPGTAILFFDVDDFKLLNDTYGHFIGDQYLTLIAKIMQTSFKKHGGCYRIGGDEFAVIIFSSETNIDELITKFHQNIESLNDDRIPHISVGYGIYQEGMDIEQVKELADKNMYHEKNKHKQKKSKFD